MMWINFCILYLCIVNISYANLASIVQNDHDNYSNFIKNSDALHHSEQETDNLISGINTLDDGGLASQSNARIVINQKQNSGENILLKTMERNTIDGLEKHKIFTQAQTIWKDPISIMNQLTETECRERTNKLNNLYTKSIIKEIKYDTEYEEQICKKSANKIMCEKVLNMECIKTEECEMGGIIKGSIDTTLKWEYNYPNLLIGNINEYHFYCGASCAKIIMPVKFHIINKNAISIFKLKRLFLNNLLMVKLNNHVVYNSLDGDKLDILSMTGWQSQINGGKGRIGYCSDNAGKKDYTYVNVDLLPYLNDGVNEIIIELIYSIYGHANILIEARQQCCTNFIEKWVEKCWIN